VGAPSRARSPAKLLALLAVSVLLAVAGCGFHLRSWDVGTSVESAYVVSNPRNPLEVPLKRALRQAGVEEAGSADDAEIVVELLDSMKERRNISVSGEGRAAEYEMLLAVHFRVTDRDGNELLAPQWLERESVFQVDRDNLVGSSEEQALLERELENGLVQQILRALNSVGTRMDDAA
jgi:LPS-assembly lipoprotein